MGAWDPSRIRPSIFLYGLICLNFSFPGMPSRNSKNKKNTRMSHRVFNRVFHRARVFHDVFRRVSDCRVFHRVFHRARAFHLVSHRVLNRVFHRVLPRVFHRVLRRTPCVLQLSCVSSGVHHTEHTCTIKHVETQDETHDESRDGTRDATHDETHA